MTTMGGLNLGSEQGNTHEGDGQKAMEGNEVTKTEQPRGGATSPRQVVLINAHAGLVEFAGLEGQPIQRDGAGLHGAHVVRKIDQVASG